jgi:membrane-associated phospholipid phosphatase
MKLLRSSSLSILLSFTMLFAKAQFSSISNAHSAATDTTAPKIDWSITHQQASLPARSLIIPGMLITYGISTMQVHRTSSINGQFKEEIWTESPHQLKTIDNYLQYAPAASVYILNAVGIKGKNNFRDRTMIYLLSNIILNSIVYPAKRITHQLRPDGSSYTSFPSGHTAEAFASAEFMRMEYKKVSPLYGIAGYLMAGTTGYLRMYNNKHWFSDVVAGAGVGILSTKLAYWLEPIIARKLFPAKGRHKLITPVF